PDRDLRRKPGRVDVFHERDDGQDAALDHDGAADRVHPHSRALSGRSRPLLDDHEPLDRRPGPGHAPARAEAGGSAQADVENAAEGTRRGGRRRREAGSGSSEADRAAAGRAPEEKEEGRETLNDEFVVETTGETVGEAKWAALRELERRRPDLDKSSVRFEVVSEGERGLLGVGYAPARVVATAAAAVETRPTAEAPVESELAADVRSLVERIVAYLDVHCSVDVHENAAGVHVQCSGGGVGLLVGSCGPDIA